MNRLGSLKKFFSVDSLYSFCLLLLVLFLGSRLFIPIGAFVAKDQGHYREATVLYSVLIHCPWLTITRETPTPWRSYTSRGFCYCKLGEYRVALQDYDRALLELEKRWGKPIRLNKNSFYVVFDGSKVYQGRGDVDLALHQYENAIADYTESIACNDLNSLSYLRRSEAYDAIGKHGLAKSDHEFAEKAQKSAKDLGINLDL
jgi:tetratricopeptide (TPR) repeat protein